jgi:molybdopterin-guanine dinucleotide biosynthesis protein A
MMTGIILSGGKSIRMGENKAFIEIEGIPIIQRIYNVFKNMFSEIIIVTDRKDLFLDFDATIYSDLIPNSGVLGGLYTGLFFSSFLHSFCVACDMPFLQKPVITYLTQQINDYDVIVPRTHDGLQPLHAIYSKNCITPIKNTIDRNHYKLVDIYPLIKMKIIEEQEFIALDPNRRSFININTPEELRLARKY